MILDLLVSFLLTDDTSCGFDDPTVGWVATDCPPVQDQLPEEVIGRAIDCPDGQVGYVIDAAGTVDCPAPIVQPAPVEAPAPIVNTPVEATRVPAAAQPAPARIVTGKWVQYAHLVR